MLLSALSLGALSACAATTSTVLSLQDLDCASCSDRVMGPLGELEGVLRMDFKLQEAELVVYHTPSVSDEMLLTAASRSQIKVVIGEGEGFYQKVLEYPEDSDVQDANSPGGQVDLAAHLAPGKVTVFDFFADWCGPCKMLGPVIDQLADEYAGKAKIAKIDIESDEDTKQLAVTQGVSSIPALMIFKDGEKVEETLGAQAKPALAAMIDNALA